MRKYLAFVAWFRSLSDDQIMRIMKSHYTKTVKTNEKYLQKYKDRYKSDSAFRQKQLEYGRQYRLKIKYDNDASV